MKEKEFEKLVKKFLLEQEIYYFKFWGGNLKTSSGNFVRTKKGVPDICCCVNGIFVGLELKQENGHPSYEQIDNIIHINKSGGLGLLVYPKDFLVLQIIIKKLLEDNNNVNNLRKQYFNITKNL